jgi:multiple antibiotic resistance protein
MTFASAAVLLFLVMDPLGNVPPFVAALARVAPARRTRVLARELLIALAALVAFLFFGRPLLGLFGIREESLAVAGGIVLLLISLRMLFPVASQADEDLDGEPFIVPLAIPFVAGPSSLATILLLAGRPGADPLVLGGALLSAWAASSAILLSAPLLQRALGRRGLVALERLMGLLLVALAVQLFLDGVRAYLA